ncbi:hypothetical protein SAMN04488028_103120 [Reichenbachiella agariperforans]|uniref:Uncharacterized protein n=1 Tax=Reichenbachiella agariperforans TaxID=156994 RepID=A0A1M6Q0G1_REIAG|nr:hypothetical protein SAMN04488028_103120 [Reichenbachiella agariperforans]
MNNEQDKQHTKKRYFLLMEVSMGVAIVGLIYFLLKLLIDI